ncbi:hypothetical protein J2S09_001324 [Bacillus fengqiuensis]|nr:hypothetical protein [Bacillus fengqiuensis]
MKKYPFSKKAVKAILAASIALSPFAATGLVAPSSVAANSQDDIETLSGKLFKFYDGVSYNFSSEKTRISGLDFDSIADVAPNKAKLLEKLSTEPEQADFVLLVKGISNIMYNSYDEKSDLEDAIVAFKDDAVNKAAFNRLFDGEGDVTLDSLVDFMIEVESELKGQITQHVIDSIGTNREISLSTVFSDVVEDVFRTGNYDKLDGKLEEIGLSVEGLFALQSNLNDKIDPLRNEIHPARSALVSNLFAEYDIDMEANEQRVYELTFKYGPVTLDLTDKVSWVTANSSIAEFNTTPANKLTAKANGTTSVIATFDGIKLYSESVTITGMGSGGSSSGGGSTPTPTPTPKPDPDPGNVPATPGDISSNPSKVADAIKNAKDFTSLEITLSNKAQDVSLPPAVLKAIIEKNKEATIDVKTDAGSYSLPASQINLADLAKELGGTADDVNIKITVKVGKDDKDVLGKNKLTAVSDVVEFTVEADVKGKKKELKTFKTYVDRTIQGKEEFDADKSVALRLEEDGSFTALPTYFTEDEAKVKSMTNSQYVVIENEKTFNDLSTAWNKEQIEKLASKYIVQGRPDGSFGPYATTTRVQLAVLLTRALGLSTDAAYDNSFKDVKGDEWFVPEVTAAVNAGIIQGKVDGSFDPNAPVSRAQAAVMINRALEFVSYDKETALDKTLKVEKFKDESKILEWARKDIETLLQAGIIEGLPNGNFDPYAQTTRSQMVKILDEALKTLKFINE